MLTKASLLSFNSSMEDKISFDETNEIEKIAKTKTLTVNNRKGKRKSMFKTELKRDHFNTVYNLGEKPP